MVKGYRQLGTMSRPTLIIAMYDGVVFASLCDLEISMGFQRLETKERANTDTCSIGSWGCFFCRFFVHLGKETIRYISEETAKNSLRGLTPYSHYRLGWSLHLPTAAEPRQNQLSCGNWRLSLFDNRGPKIHPANYRQLNGILAYRINIARFHLVRNSNPSHLG